MKTTAILLLSLTLLTFGNSFAMDKGKDVNWDVFSKNLVRALTSQNDGLQESAMRHVITYGDQLNIRDGVLDILHVYRSHEDLQARRLALTALPRLNDPLINGFLRRAVDFEKSTILKRQLQFIIAEQTRQ